MFAGFEGKKVHEFFGEKIDFLIEFLNANKSQSFFYICDINYLIKEMDIIKDKYQEQYIITQKNFVEFLGFLETNKTRSDLQELFQQQFAETKECILSMCELFLRYKSFYYRFKYPMNFTNIFTFTYTCGGQIISSLGGENNLKLDNELFLSENDIGRIRKMWCYLYSSEMPLSILEHPFLFDVFIDSEIKSKFLLWQEGSCKNIDTICTSVVELLKGLKESLPKSHKDFSQLNPAVVDAPARSCGLYPALSQSDLSQNDFLPQSIRIRVDRMTEAGEDSGMIMEISQRFLEAEKEIMNLLVENLFLLGTPAIAEFTQVFSFVNKWNRDCLTYYARTLSDSDTRGRIVPR